MYKEIIWSERFIYNGEYIMYVFLIEGPYMYAVRSITIIQENF